VPDAHTPFEAQADPTAHEKGRTGELRFWGVARITALSLLGGLHHQYVRI